LPARAGHRLHGCCLSSLLSPAQRRGQRKRR
jgi:hypothetical protein